MGSSAGVCERCGPDTKKHRVTLQIASDRPSAIRYGVAAERYRHRWKITRSTTVHAGHARYFTPPPSELITDVTIAKFVGTTNQRPGIENSPVKAESSNCYDAGSRSA
jgi:hypothetical protein